jgi:hypothetical protein
MDGRGMCSPRIKNGKLQFLLTRSLRVVAATRTHAHTHTHTHRYIFSGEAQTLLWNIIIHFIYLKANEMFVKELVKITTFLDVTTYSLVGFCLLTVKTYLPMVQTNAHITWNLSIVLNSTHGPLLSIYCSQAICSEGGNNTFLWNLWTYSTRQHKYTLQNIVILRLTEIKCLYTTTSTGRWNYLSFNLCGGTLGTAAANGRLYQPRMIGDDDCTVIGGMKIGRGSRSTRRKP